MYKVLSSVSLRKKVNEGSIKHVEISDISECIQPASIDLQISNTGYVLKEKFSPINGTVKEYVDRFSVNSFEIGDGYTLYKGQSYIFEAFDVELKEDEFMYFSPKSSIGRVDLLCRAVFDNNGLYDRSVKGYKGKVWVEVTPQSFNVIIKKGLPIIQAIITKEGGEDLNIRDNHDIFIGNNGDYENIFFDDSTLVLTLSVQPNELVGYVSKETNLPLDMREVGKLDINDFFTPIYSKDDKSITIEKNKFYILKTKENVSVPPIYEGEMLPLSHYVGELRAHYAGFFDPGFGFGENGEVGGNPGVLEVRPYETYKYYDEQPICLFKYYELTEKPEQVYGKLGNNYSNQKGIKVAKYFKQ